MSSDDAQKIWKLKVSLRLRTSFKFLPHDVQEHVWLAMNKICCNKIPTAAYASADCVTEETDHICKISKGLMISFRILEVYKQIEFTNLWKSS